MSTIKNAMTGLLPGVICKQTPSKIVCTIVYTVVYAIFVAAFFAASIVFAQAAPLGGQARDTNTPVVEIEIADIQTENGMLFANVRVRLAESATSPLNNVIVAWQLEESVRVNADGSVEPALLWSAGVAADKKGRNAFGVLPGETIPRAISAPYPMEVRSSDNTLIVSLVDPLSGRVIASRSAAVRLEGGGGYFVTDPYVCTLRIGTTPFFSTAILKQGERPNITCKVSSPFADARDVMPVFETTAGGLLRRADVADTQKGKAISFAPFETKIIDIEIPSIPDKPQQYETLFWLQDTQGHPVSSVRTFNWVVQGPGATVERVSFDKDGYAKGETAILGLTFAQSADLLVSRMTNVALRESAPDRWHGTPLQNPRVQITVRNGAGRTCGNAEETLPPLAADRFSGTLTIPLARNCVDPSATIRISEGSRELTTAVYRTRSLLATAERLRSNTMWYMLGAIIALALAAGALLLKKRHLQSGVGSQGDADSIDGETHNDSNEEAGSGDDSGQQSQPPLQDAPPKQENTGSEEDLRFIYPDRNNTPPNQSA